MMTYWWNIPGKIQKSFVEARRPVVAQDVFAIYHYCIASKTEVGSVRIPQVFCFGNALWLTLEYYSGNIMKNRMNVKQRKLLIEGMFHKALVNAQIKGKIFLRKSGGVLCGPDEYFTRMIIPLGMDFYWGTFIPEMNLCIAKGLNYVQIMKHDFNECELMKEVRSKDRFNQKKWKVFEKKRRAIENKRRTKVVARQN